MAMFTRTFLPWNSSLLSSPCYPPRITPHLSLFTVEQRATLGEIIDVGCGADDRLHQARFSVHTDVHLHAVVPRVALLGCGWMHLRVTLTGLVLGRAGRRNDAGIDHSARLEQQALLGHVGVDGCQDLRGNLVPFQQMSGTWGFAKAQDGCLVGQPRCPFQTHKAPVQRALMQFLFHGWVAQVPPQLQAMNAQHGLHCKRRASAQSLVRAARVRLNQRYKRRPGHHLVHLIEEDFFAGLLGQRIKAERDLFHVRDVARYSSPNPVRGGGPTFLLTLYCNLGEFVSDRFCIGDFGGLWMPFSDCWCISNDGWLFVFALLR